MSYRIADFGPNDLLTSDNEGVRRQKVSVNEQLIDGNKAITVQEFTELNIKNGVQFYARAAYPLISPILSGTSILLYFETGSKTVLVKDRLFNYVAEELRIQIYANPTGVTGGSQITISNWNSVNPQPTSIVSALKGVSVATTGTAIQDPEYFFGGGAAGQRDQNGIPEGYERVLPPFASFLVEITNTGAGIARCQYGLSWYEGDLSVNIPLEI